MINRSGVKNNVYTLSLEPHVSKDVLRWVKVKGIRHNNGKLHGGHMSISLLMSNLFLDFYYEVIKKDLFVHDSDNKEDNKNDS